MSEITMTFHIVGPTWAWYFVGACVALAVVALALKLATDAYSTWWQIGNIPR